MVTSCRHRGRRRAFSLAELLVVIGIITILCGLLFPVFARAKVNAQRTSDIMNLKSTSAAIFLYASDSDEMFPFGYLTLNNDHVGSNSFVPVPNDWEVPVPDWQQERAAGAWPNSAAPYLKSFRILSITGAPDVKIVYSDYNKRRPDQALPAIGLTFNGLLSAWSTTAVEEPESVPLLSQVRGKENTLGYSYSIPRLHCAEFGPCLYQPAKAGCNRLKNGETSSLFNEPGSSQDIYQNSQVYATVGGSVRSFTVTQSPRRLSDPDREFYATYGDRRDGISQWKDEFTCHSLKFRPDFHREDVLHATIGNYGGNAP